MNKLIQPLEIIINQNCSLLENFLIYCTNNQNLKNLKMVIGANGKSITDTERLGKYYDIAIDSNYLPESNDGLLSLNHYDNNVYQELLPILKGKFIEIIFDWSVTKFFRNTDLEKILPQLGELLQPNGKLYIDQFSACPYGGCIGILWTSNINGQNLLFTQKYDEFLQRCTMEKRKILKNEKDIFSRKRRQFVIRDESGNSFYKVNLEQLFDNMDENGSFDESLFKNTISFEDESQELFEKVFNNNYNIENYKDTYYPHNETRIGNYYIITKIK